MPLPAAASVALSIRDVATSRSCVSVDGVSREESAHKPNSRARRSNSAGRALCRHVREAARGGRKPTLGLALRRCTLVAPGGSNSMQISNYL